MSGRIPDPERPQVGDVFDLNPTAAKTREEGGHHVWRLRSGANYPRQVQCVHPRQGMASGMFVPEPNPGGWRAQFIPARFLTVPIAPEGPK